MALGLLRRTVLERCWDSRWSANSVLEQCFELLGVEPLVELLGPAVGHHCEVFAKPEVLHTRCGWARD